MTTRRVLRARRLVPLLAPLLALLALVALAAAQSAAPVAPGALPNIIFVVVDALRSDHVSANGYARPTTPQLDAWVADAGVTFRDASTVDAWTYPSNAATFTGRDPTRLGVDWADPLGAISADETLLAETLHDAGYATAGFVAAHFVSARYGFDAGFDVYEDAIAPAGANKVRAEAVNARALAWLHDDYLPGRSAQPLYLHLYYYDPHTWYLPLPPYDVLYDATYTGTLSGDVYQDGLPVITGAIVPTERDVEHLLALYDGEITYWDTNFGAMMGELDGMGLLDNAIIVVTSDHGQMFGEHGKWVHRNSLYEEVLRVPLLLRYDGVVPAGTITTTPVQTLDIVPTLLGWLGLPPPDDVQGRDLGPMLAGGPPPERTLIYSELGVDRLADPDYYAPPLPLYAVRDGNWKYIFQQGVSQIGALCQLNPTSPYETDEVGAIHPAQAAALKQAVQEWFGLHDRWLFLPDVQRP